MSEQRNVAIIAGPNGSGKSTVAEVLLREGNIQNFINADVIARGLNSHEPQQVSFEAGRLMLQIVNEALLSQANFSFETTLSGKYWKKFIRDAKSAGYNTNIYFVVVDSVDIAVERVASRVKKGGHSIPEDTIRRRYRRSLEMFKEEYSRLVDAWWVFDNTLDESKIIGSKNTCPTFSSKNLRRIFDVK